MSSPAMVPIATPIGIVEIGPATHADIDAALEILNEAAALASFARDQSMACRRVSV
jgi:hypothetical protein